MIETETSYRAALGVSRAIARQNEADTRDRRRVEVVFGGNCNVDFLKPGFEAAMWADGVLPVSRSTGYDDWIGAAMDGSNTADAWVIWLSSMAWSRHGQQRPAPPVETIAAAVIALRRRGATVVVVLPEPVPEEADPFSPFAAWRADLVARVRAVLAEHAVLVDPAGLLMQMPIGEWSDFRYWIAAKCPWSPDAATRLGALCGHVLARLARPRVRAVAVDLDDTLWGGVVGELGADGVVLDPMGEGGPFLALQRFLKDLSDSGVMLAAVSKNNLSDAVAVFERRAEMILKQRDFLRFDANWSNKAESVRRLAETLQIGLDAICFLDNSPHERSEMRHLLPDVIVPELPESPGDWLGFLHDSRLFLKPAIREDDLKRVEAYRADASRRRQAEAAPDRKTYLDGLQMRLSAYPIDAARLPRASELVQKTNQFNLTNRRHSERNILEIAQSDRAYAYSFELADVFGESGTIAVVLGTPESTADGVVLDIDTFVMSCRVINRTVERAIFEHLLRWTRAHGVTRVRGRFVASARNGLVAGFFASLGLDPLENAAGAETPEALFEGANLPFPQHHVHFNERGLDA